MGRLGYAAANLGDNDLGFGIERLQEWAKQASVPLISSNLVFQDSGDPALPPTLVRTVPLGGSSSKKKIRVGILGLAPMNPALSAKTPEGRRMVIADPLTTARSLVPALRKKCDFLIALVGLEPNQAKELAKEVPGIDLILGGFGAVETSDEIKPVAPSAGAVPGRLLYVGNQGKKVGEIRVFFTSAGALTKLESSVIALGVQVPDDPAIMDIVEKNRIAINEIHKKEAPLVDGAKILAMWQGDAFLGSAACKSCHEEAYQMWATTSHAHAFRILEEKHQDYNPDCVGCHSTGFRRPTGFVNAKSTPDLMNVQCESCHGPGRGHPETNGSSYGAVAQGFCVTCHTPENSPDFDASAYRLKIRHWKETAGEAAPAASSR
jgi:cytochrome c554/c'-like protein